MPADTADTAPSRRPGLARCPSWIWPAAELDTLSPVERRVLFEASIVRDVDELPPTSKTRIFRSVRRQTLAAEALALVTGAPPVVPLDLAADVLAGADRQSAPRSAARRWITAAARAHPDHAWAPRHAPAGNVENGATAMTDDNAGKPATAADAFDAVLRERAGEHPDVEVYLRMRQCSRSALSRLWDPQAVSPDAMAWALQALGADDTEAAYHARANAVVDALTGRTPEAVARAADIGAAEQAALAWLRAVTEAEPSPEVTARLHETSVRHQAGIGYGTAAVALIQAAVGVLVDTARAGGAD